MNKPLIDLDAIEKKAIEATHPDSYVLLRAAMAISVCEEVPALTREVRRLRALIHDAPHTEWCAWKGRGGCTCWKRTVAAPVSEAVTNP